jgi:hypothetical protein
VTDSHRHLGGWTADGRTLVTEAIAQHGSDLHAATMGEKGSAPYLKVTRESLDERTFQGAWSEGRAMPLAEAVQYALQQESV